MFEIPSVHRQAAFDECFKRCMVKEGDTVRFKKPKKNPIYGLVDHIEMDVRKMYWTEGEKPRYIRVSIEKTDQQTGEITNYHVWVRERDLMYVPKAKHETSGANQT